MEQLLYGCDICGVSKRPQWPGQKPEGWESLRLPVIQDDGLVIADLLCCPECSSRVAEAVAQLRTKPKRGRPPKNG